MIVRCQCIAGFIIHIVPVKSSGDSDDTVEPDEVDSVDAVSSSAGIV